MENPSVDELRRYECHESSDRVPRDSESTAFKQHARLHQAKWRERNNIRIGAQPIRPNKQRGQRQLGSRIDVFDAYRDESNFLGDPVRRAARYRVAHHEPHQMLYKDRLYCDLLSSMPMCFNLFGWFHEDPSLATEAARVLWPDAPGEVTAVRFEWSPGRLDPEYLGNRSAFDVAFDLALADGSSGVIGVETKYHEHCKVEKPPRGDRLKIYGRVSDRSEVFKSGAIERIVGTDLQQIWLDHLLVLSMLQHPSGKWQWARFVLVYPERNPSFRSAVARYASMLSEAETFQPRTIESTLEAGALPEEVASAFRDRYLW